MDTKPSGHGLLDAWVKAEAARRGVKPNAVVKDAAKATGRTPVAVYNWIGGDYRPTEGFVRQKLASFTGGAVPEWAWLTAKEQAERAVLAAVA